MIYFKALLVLLWLSACAEGLYPNATICVANGSGREAECPNFYPVFQRLSDLTANETSCNTVHIYLTSGTHILDKNFDLRDSVEETEILGAPHGQPSTIECLNNTGIRFSEKNHNRALISNVVFLHCRTTRTSTISYRDYRSELIHVALYFKRALYTLNSVTVKGTEGHGLYAFQCREQIIYNCTITNNIRNFCLLFWRTGSLYDERHNHP
jgi:hypothetical protein